MFHNRARRNQHCSAPWRKLFFAPASLVSVNAFANFDAGAAGITVGQMSRNVSASLGSVSAGMEAFLYLLGIVFFVLALLLARRHHARDKEGGGRSIDKDNPAYVFTYVLAFVISVLCFAAPSVLKSGALSIFGTATLQTIGAPTQDPPGFR